ncbi:hypothetical protein [uncultured Tenacibaculum sp.]|uniref:hypothetical protein n=1 Tax=uncultured Tenacibaculum sp. TaxID=174713 RepID=UPI00262F1455|nr:hypothetical protein [uncultured Tenacibaculum sp.]
MDVKDLKMESNSLNKKVIEIGETPFKLWLEFEESSPWDNIENDFANIEVNTLDGRKYGINVWTFKFLESAIKLDEESGENLNGLYLRPPDLFVKELSRDCVEKSIADLLEKGNLEDSLNHSIFGLEFLEPYWDAFEMEEKSIQVLINELKIELPDNHLLRNENFELIARKSNNDDIVLELEDEQIVVVHLTWKSKKEIDGYPITRFYKDKVDFWNNEMKQDVIEFK